MSNKTRHFIVAAWSISILAVGILGFLGLSALKQPPQEITPPEMSLTVRVFEVQPEHVTAILSGTGTVRCRETVNIIPEVSGRIIEIHPRLDVGEVLRKGEVLFRIDPPTYQARADDAEALVHQLEASVQRIQTQYSRDRSRLDTAKRSLELTQSDFARTRDLFHEDDVGTAAGVERAEMTWIQAQDTLDQLEKVLASYPQQIQESLASLESAKARVQQTHLDLERTKVLVPFDGRIKMQNIREGQYVTPGAAVVSLANDDLLEIALPLNSTEARIWLPFSETENPGSIAWYAQPEPVQCTVRWVEDPTETWNAVLHRIESMDEATRTLTVTVRIEGSQAISEQTGRPLVEGMFCRVDIPGRQMESVYRVPRNTVSFENTVYLAVDNRLQTRSVDVARFQDEYAYIQSGLSPGDLVVLTRLSHPMENIQLHVRYDDNGENR